jgi:DNA-binding NarL/FixJ family response regulator
VRILLADHHSLFREAVRAIMEKEPDMEVVAEVADGAQAVMEAERHRPDVAILSPGLPDVDVIQATEVIRERVPSCRVAIVSSDYDVLQLVRAVELGASGYMTRESAVEELLEMARAVHRGDTIVPPPMLGDLLEELKRRRETRDDAVRQLAKLTRREREVLALLSEGAAHRAIAETLVISPQTARTHVQNLLSKLGLHSMLEAVAFVNRTDVRDELFGSNAGGSLEPLGEDGSAAVLIANGARGHDDL